MRIQLNVFQVKQFKNVETGQLQKSEDMAHLKKKYIRLLKMYQEVSHELAVYKSKTERTNHLLDDAQYDNYKVIK